MLAPTRMHNWQRRERSALPLRCLGAVAPCGGMRFMQEPIEGQGGVWRVGVGRSRAVPQGRPPLKAAWRISSIGSGGQHRQRSVCPQPGPEAHGCSSGGCS